MTTHRILRDSEDKQFILICFAASQGYFYNTAWSTALNKNGERILTQETEIVTAHEFGHNWGNKTTLNIFVDI